MRVLLTRLVVMIYEVIGDMNDKRTRRWNTMDSRKYSIEHFGMEDRMD